MLSSSRCPSSAATPAQNNPSSFRSPPFHRVRPVRVVVLVVRRGESCRAEGTGELALRRHLEGELERRKTTEQGSKIECVSLSSVRQLRDSFLVLSSPLVSAFHWKGRKSSPRTLVPWCRCKGPGRLPAGASSARSPEAVRALAGGRSGASPLPSSKKEQSRLKTLLVARLRPTRPSLAPSSLFLSFARLLPLAPSSPNLRELSSRVVRFVNQWRTLLQPPLDLPPEVAASFAPAVVPLQAPALSVFSDLASTRTFLTVSD